MAAFPHPAAQLFEMLQGYMGVPKEEPLKGRSRKFRCGDSSSCGIPKSMVHVPNPVVPLRFERSSWSGFDYIGTEVHGLQVSFATDFVNPAVFQSHLLALNAYSAPTWQAAEREARIAIDLAGGLCPEAYNVLAVAAAGTYEEALEFYRTAADQGPKLLPPHCFELAVSERSMWPRSPYRAFLRGLYGMANTLRKMGRYKEAVAVYDKLLGYDSNWYQFTSFVNYTATYPAALLGAQGAQAVFDWMRSWPSTADHCTYLSSSIYFIATATLAELELSAATGRDGFGNNRAQAAVTAQDGWAADGIEASLVSPDDSPWAAMKRGRLLLLMCNHYPLAVDMLLGDKAIPASGPAPECIGDLATATSYVFTCGSQWRSRPGALERLRKYRNTFELQCLLLDLRAGLPASELLPEIKHYMSTAAGGFHSQAIAVIPGTPGLRGLVDFLMTEPKGKDFKAGAELKVLRWLLDAGCPVRVNHPAAVNDSAIHMVCYQGYGPEAVKMLIAAGADPFQPGDQEGLSAASMTANQGNWREMQAIFEALPHSKTATGLQLAYNTRLPAPKFLTIPELMIFDLFNSSCLACLSGGQRCRRCSNGIPHSRHADFFKFAEVLAETVPDLKLNAAVLDEMNGCSAMGGPGSPWAKLAKHTKNVFAVAAQKHKAAGAAASDSSSTAAAGAAGASSSTSAQPVAASSKAAAASATAKADAAASAAGKSGPEQTKADAGANKAAGKKCCWCCDVAGVPLQVCSGCKKALYCSVECQNNDWKAHKKTCKEWRAAAAAKKKASGSPLP